MPCFPVHAFCMAHGGNDQAKLQGSSIRLIVFRGGRGGRGAKYYKNETKSIPSELEDMCHMWAVGTAGLCLPLCLDISQGSPMALKPEVDAKNSMDPRTARTRTTTGQGQNRYRSGVLCVFQSPSWELLLLSS